MITFRAVGLRRTALAAGVLTAVFRASVGGGQATQISDRGNLFEWGYYALAINLASASDGDSSRLCDRISPTTRDRHDGQTKDYSAKSRCFMAVAQNVQRSDLCARVLPALPDGSGVSRQECVAEIDRRAGGASYGLETAAVLLFAMNYGDADVRRSYPDHPEVPRYDEFLASLDTSVLNRIVRLPDFTKGDEAARQQVRLTVAGCQEARGAVGCEVVACGFLRDRNEAHRCIEQVQTRFNRDLGVRKAPPPYKPSSNCSGNTESTEADARNLAHTIVSIDTKGMLDLVLPLYAPDAVLLPPDASPVRGAAAIKEWHSRFLDEFWFPKTPDLTWGPVCVEPAQSVVEFQRSGLRRSRRSPDPEMVREAYVVVLQPGRGRLEVKQVSWRRLAAIH